MNNSLKSSSSHANCPCVRGEFPCSCCQKDEANLSTEEECTCGCGLRKEKCCLKVD